MTPNPDLQRRLGSIEELLHKIDSSADPSVRATVQELVELVMSLHGAGIERILDLIHATGDAGEVVIQKLSADELVAGLLALYGLHPIALEARVNRVLDKVRSRLHAEVELVSIEEGAVRLRVHATGHGCGSTAESIKEQVEEMIYRAAPDLTALIIDGLDDKQGFVPLEMLSESRLSPVLSVARAEP